MHDLAGEWMFRLLYHRSARAAFLAGSLELPGELKDDLESIDHAELLRASEKTLSLLQATLKNSFPAIFEKWAQITPRDPHGHELVAHFAESAEFRESANFAWSPLDRSFLTAFVQFLDRPT